MAHEVIGEILLGVDAASGSDIKGLVTKKLSNNKMVIRPQKSEDVYTINPDLYLNKKEGDSIILK